MSKDTYSIDLCEFISESIEEKKGRNITILELKEKSDGADYFVIATVDSEPQLRAITNWIEDELKDRGVKMKGRDGHQSSDWIGVDYFSVLVHLFKEEARFKYNLESMWNDANKFKFENSKMVKI